MSSVCSATLCFSRRCSSSSCFSRLHLTEFHPAALRLPAVVGLLGDPVRPAQIGDLPPGLASLTIARICSSVYLLRSSVLRSEKGPHSLRAGAGPVASQILRQVALLNRAVGALLTEHCTDQPNDRRQRSEAPDAIRSRPFTPTRCAPVGEVVLGSPSLRTSRFAHAAGPYAPIAGQLLIAKDTFRRMER
jgi:hypothetical protein